MTSVLMSDVFNSPDVISGEFRQVLYRQDVAVALSNFAKDRGTTARVHLKVETGTHRQGVALGNLEGFVKELLALSNLEIEGVEKPETVAWIDPIHKG